MINFDEIEVPQKYKDSVWARYGFNEEPGLVEQIMIMSLEMSRIVKDMEDWFEDEEG